MWDYRAKRSDKIRAKGDDGDTMLLLIDEGLNDRAEEPIRLTGVTAPESYQPGGQEAANQLRLICEEIEERAQARRTRWPFIVYTEPNTAPEPSERRSLTRWVGTVFAFDYPQTGEPSVNDQMAEFLALHPEWGAGIRLSGDD